MRGLDYLRVLLEPYIRATPYDIFVEKINILSFAPSSVSNTLHHNVEKSVLVFAFVLKQFLVS